MALSESQIIEALKANAGFITGAAKMLNVTYHAIYDRIQRSEYLKNNYQEIQESHLDLAESKLLQNIKGGNLGAICFFLKCRGKSRGYIETSKHELSGPDGGPITVVGTGYPKD